jgi:signal transduction histidine kinase
VSDIRQEVLGAVPAATYGRRRLVVLCYVLILLIIVLDWMTAVGVAVGFLLSIPIVVISMLGRPKPVLVATAVALGAFAIASTLGPSPISPPSVWVPNRILEIFAVIASGAVALMAQRHRRSADDALRSALSARDTNRLLMSLMAHDLRAPLVAASQVLEYVERSAATGTPLDAELVGDTRLRLRRNLRVIEEVLQISRGDMRPSASFALSPVRSYVGVAQEIEREAASFAGEAAAAGKRIVVRAECVRGVEMGLDALVLRQVLAILLDNAIRYARPGPLWVDAELGAGEVLVSVTDTGPGLSARPGAEAGSAGSGLGLELCRALAARVGGSLELQQDSEHATRFCLHLPIAARSDTPEATPWLLADRAADPATIAQGFVRSRAPHEWPAQRCEQS